MTEITLHDLAQDVLAEIPNASKSEWGDRLARLVDEQGDAVAEEAHAKYVASLGAYVSRVKAGNEKVKQHERAISRGVTYTGRLLTPTLSVRTDTGTQTVLWLEASPRQFVEAVFREQSVAVGRLNSNKLRIKVAEMCRGDEHLMELATLAAVCAELGVEPAELELEVLAS